MRQTILMSVLVIFTSLLVETSALPLMTNATLSNSPELARRAAGKAKNSKSDSRPPSPGGSKAAPPPTTTTTAPPTVTQAAGVADTNDKNPGSYAVMCPRDRFLIYDSKFRSYLTYFKFGDTSTEHRDREYSTHDPTIVFKSRKDNEPSRGKYMEREILKKLVNRYKAPGEYQGMVQGVGTTNSDSGKSSEWYEIYLGTNIDKAFAAKERLRMLLTDYGADEKQSGTYNGMDEKAYIEKFLALFPNPEVADGTRPRYFNSYNKGPEAPNWRETSRIPAGVIG